MLLDGAEEQHLDRHPEADDRDHREGRAEDRRCGFGAGRRALRLRLLGLRRRARTPSCDRRTAERFLPLLHGRRHRRPCSAGTADPDHGRDDTADRAEQDQERQQATGELGVDRLGRGHRDGRQRPRSVPRRVRRRTTARRHRAHLAAVTPPAPPPSVPGPGPPPFGAPLVSVFGGCLRLDRVGDLLGRGVELGGDAGLPDRQEAVGQLAVAAARPLTLGRRDPDELRDLGGVLLGQVLQPSSRVDDHRPRVGAGGLADVGLVEGERLEGLALVRDIATARTERLVRRRDVRARLGLEGGVAQSVATGVAEAGDAEHEPGAERLPVDPAELVELGAGVVVAAGLDVGPGVEQRLGDLAHRGDRRRDVVEVDRRVLLPAVALRLRDVAVEQRPERDRQVEVLVLRVDDHAPRVRLAVQEVERVLVLRDVVGELLDDVRGVRQRQHRRADLLADLAQPRVELDELGVVHDRDRVVGDARVPATEVGADVRLGRAA